MPLDALVRAADTAALPGSAHTPSALLATIESLASSLDPAIAHLDAKRRHATAEWALITSLRSLIQRISRRVESVAIAAAALPVPRGSANEAPKDGPAINALAVSAVLEAPLSEVLTAEEADSVLSLVYRAGMDGIALPPDLLPTLRVLARAMVHRERRIARRAASKAEAKAKEAAKGQAGTDAAASDAAGASAADAKGGRGSSGSASTATDAKPGRSSGRDGAAAASPGAQEEAKSAADSDGDSSGLEEDFGTGDVSFRYADAPSRRMARAVVLEGWRVADELLGGAVLSPLQGSCGDPGQASPQSGSARGRSEFDRPSPRPGALSSSGLVFHQAREEANDRSDKGDAPHTLPTTVKRSVKDVVVGADGVARLWWDSLEGLPLPNRVDRPLWARSWRERGSAALSRAPKAKRRAADSFGPGSQAGSVVGEKGSAIASPTGNAKDEDADADAADPALAAPATLQPAPRPTPASLPSSSSSAAAAARGNDHAAHRHIESIEHGGPAAPMPMGVARSAVAWAWGARSAALDALRARHASGRVPSALEASLAMPAVPAALTAARRAGALAAAAAVESGQAQPLPYMREAWVVPAPVLAEQAAASLASLIASPHTAPSIAHRAMASVRRFAAVPSAREALRAALVREALAAAEASAASLNALAAASRAAATRMEARCDEATALLPGSDDEDDAPAAASAASAATSAAAAGAGAAARTGEQQEADDDDDLAMAAALAVSSGVAATAPGSPPGARGPSRPAGRLGRARHARRALLRSQQAAEAAPGGSHLSVPPSDLRLGLLLRAIDALSPFQGGGGVGGGPGLALIDDPSAPTDALMASKRAIASALGPLRVAGLAAPAGPARFAAADAASRRGASSASSSAASTSASASSSAAAQVPVALQDHPLFRVGAASEDAAAAASKVAASAGAGPAAAADAAAGSSSSSAAGETPGRLPRLPLAVADWSDTRPGAAEGRSGSGSAALLALRRDSSTRSIASAAGGSASAALEPPPPVWTVRADGLAADAGDLDTMEAVSLQAFALLDPAAAPQAAAAASALAARRRLVADVDENEDAFESLADREGRALAGPWARRPPHHPLLLPRAHRIAPAVSSELARAGRAWLRSGEAPSHVWGPLAAYRARARRPEGREDAPSRWLRRFLPIVEAFFVAHEPPDDELAASAEARNRSSQWAAFNAYDDVMAQLSAPADDDAAAATRPAGVMHEAARWLAKPATGHAERRSRGELRVSAFAESCSVLLNGLIRSRPSLLAGPFAPLLRLSECRPLVDFDNKRKFFRRQCAERFRSRLNSGGRFSLTLKRSTLLQDAFRAFSEASPEDLHKRLTVNFSGEFGQDAGGLTREFFSVITRELFDPNYGYWRRTPQGTFQPDPRSRQVQAADFVSFFRFSGRVVGKALLDGQLVDAHFTRSFYKHILGAPIAYHDLEDMDPEFYRSLRQVLEMDIDEAYLGLVFAADEQGLDKVHTVPLVPGGEDIDVTEANKMEYVQLVAQHRMTSSILEQSRAFLRGFFEVVPRDLVSIFTESELELIICGLPTIDLDDLRANTVYQGFRPTDQVIRWFWAALRSFDEQDRARFIMFATGTSKVPLEGFKALQGTNGTQLFTITRANGGDERLPSSHTCFNSIEIPGGYSSKASLRQRLLLAVREGSEGFGMA
ncbi:hypothetical protein FNF28_01291 [Cafeteria roenbergensis]|uniref:HECT-type E3 ubiquitin transferase n=1 Tax=Cafeteria roenbergensis TaxID=33653 RepID=A0A5A8DZX1_CAFRO|nr:hypothetical protein FNF28_01291 [Cafeteria roenbergensis]